MSSSSSAPASTTPVSRLRAQGRGRLVDRLTWGVAVANLVAQIGIIVTGAAVRLTGSGLGCSQWPMCEPGAFTPQFHAAMTFHPVIEFGNRMLGVVVGIIALALVVSVRRLEPTASRPPAVRRLAWLILLGVGLQGLIGGITVWVDLHPATVGSHMLISLALVAVSTYLLVRLRSPDGRARPVSSPSARGVGLAMSTVGVLLLVLGVVTSVGVRGACRRWGSPRPSRAEPPGSAGLGMAARDHAGAGCGRLRPVLHRTARAARRNPYARLGTHRRGSGARGELAVHTRTRTLITAHPIATFGPVPVAVAALEPSAATR